jgi:thiol-disulfide isomerase/thioredoxin
MTPQARAALLLLTSGVAIWAGARLFQTLAPAPLRTATAPDSMPEQEPQAGVQPDEGIPTALPEFSLDDLGGKKTSVSQWRGRPLMINFWATWCAPCRREIPLLQSLHESRTAAGMEVIGIAVDYVDKVRDFKERYKISYPLLVGEQEALDLTRRLGVETPAFPFTVFTDRRGRIVTLYLGELKRPVAEAILAVVDELDAGRMELAPARARIDAQVRALREAG